MMNLIIDEIVQSYNEYIIALNNEIPKLIQVLRVENNKVKINKEILDLFEGVEWIIKVNLNLRDLDFENNIDIERINKILKEIAQAYEFKDFNLCADILEYEFLEEIYKFKTYKVLNINEDKPNE